VQLVNDRETTSHPRVALGLLQWEACSVAAWLSGGEACALSTKESRRILRLDTRVSLSRSANKKTQPRRARLLAREKLESVGFLRARCSGPQPDERPPAWRRSILHGRWLTAAMIALQRITVGSWRLPRAGSRFSAVFEKSAGPSQSVALALGPVGVRFRGAPQMM